MKLRGILRPIFWLALFGALWGLIVFVEQMAGVYDLIGTNEILRSIDRIIWAVLGGMFVWEYRSRELQTKNKR